MARPCRIAGLIVVIASFSAPSVQAAGWGSIKGRFAYDGVPPAPVAVQGVPAMCGNAPIFGEDLVVNPKNSGIANVCVWVRGKVEVNPAFQKNAAANVVLDNKGCQFVPHIVGIRVGQTLVIQNSDPVAHSTKIDGLSLQINPLLPPGARSNQLINLPETLPAPVSCSIHGWMSARLVVRPNPYFAISDPSGDFEIKDLPVGDLEFQIWHEHVGYVTHAKTNAGAVVWPKGRVNWKIQNGVTANLGEMKIVP